MKVTDEHVHDTKVLPELVNDIIKLDKKKLLVNSLLMEPMKVMIFLDVSWQTMEYCHVSN